MLLLTRKKPVFPKLALRSLFICISLVILSGCRSIDPQSTDNESNQALFFWQDNLEQRLAELNSREESLIIREAAISARESELVTLFAELLKQKQQLDEQQEQQNRLNQVTRAPNSRAASQTSKSAKQNSQNSQDARNRTAASKTDAIDQRTVLGGLEYVYLDPPGIYMSARIDTGAQTSSLNALDMVEFERDGKPYIKFNIIDPETEKKIELVRRVRGHTKIKKHKIESQRRPIVQLRVKLGNLDELISFTLVDRSKFKQQILIGRNFLRDLAIVDVSKEFTIPKIDSNTQQ